jgi:anion-transporting  ArsA/GET3 family ATPase
MWKDILEREVACAQRALDGGVDAVRADMRAEGQRYLDTAYARYAGRLEAELSAILWTARKILDGEARK